MNQPPLFPFYNEKYIKRYSKDNDSAQEALWTGMHREYQASTEITQFQHLFITENFVS